MSLSTASSSVSYAGNGTTTVMPVPFRFLANSDLTVTKISATGAETVQLEGLHYGVSGAGDSSGNVNMLAAPAVGETIRIDRTVALTQPTTFPLQGPFSPKSHENALDRAVMMAQQLERDATLLEARVSTAEQKIDLAKAAEKQSGAGTVSALAFGCIGDGDTDNTAGLVALRAYLRANDGLTVVFPPGTYRHKNAMWLKGVKNVRVVGYGAKFQNTFAWSNDADAAGIDTNPDYLLECPDGPGGSAENAPTYLINTSAAYATSVTCTTAAQAANFAPGNRILVYGYDQQNGGYPPNVRFTEVRTVKTVNPTTGVITLDRPLLNAYDSRWYSIPPRVVNLDRAAFQLAESIELEGVEFLDHATNEPFITSRTSGRGHQYFRGALHIRLIRCKLGYVTPTMVERLDFIDCEVSEVEPDKMVDVVTFKGTTVKSIIQGIGCRLITLTDGKVIDNLAVGPRQFVADNVEIHAVDSSGADQAKARVTSETAIYSRCRFHRRPGELAKPILAGDERRSLVVESTGAGYIEVTPTLDTSTWYDPVSFLAVGTLLYKGALDGSAAGGNSKRGVVSAIYQQGAKIRIEASFNEQPVVGETFYYSRMQTLVVQDCFEIGENGVARPLIVASPDRVQFYRNTFEGGRARRLVVPIPQSASEVPIPINGYIERMLVNVAQAGTGTAANVFMWFSGAVYGEITVNGKTAGVRELSAFGSQSYPAGGPAGAIAGDAIGALAMRYATNVNLSITGSFTTLPKGVIVFDIVDHA